LTMSSATSTTSLPSGLRVLVTFPDVLFIPEIVFGGLVWILVASSRVPSPILQGWVMFVSVFCFVMTITLLCLYMGRVHGGSSSWVTLVSVCDKLQGLSSPNIAGGPVSPNSWAGSCLCRFLFFHFVSVFPCFLGCHLPATLVYVIHEVFSLLRWK
ncbi:MAL protein, partial [Rhinopomastus cyanomelas]|nr:MAL protein [Rhinopomastus cyanomelas]